MYNKAVDSSHMTLTLSYNFEWPSLSLSGDNADSICHCSCPDTVGLYDYCRWARLHVAQCSRTESYLFLSLLLVDIINISAFHIHNTKEVARLKSLV